jgi:hypothetical protein
MIIYLGIKQNNTLPVEVLDFTHQLLSESDKKILMVQKIVEIKNKDLVKFIKLRFQQNIENGNTVKFLKVNFFLKNFSLQSTQKKIMAIFS